MHAPFNFVANWLETQASPLGCLISHFEKNICFQDSILERLTLAFLQPFKCSQVPFRSALEHTPVLIDTCPFILKKSVNNPDRNCLHIPESRNRDLSRTLLRRIQEAENKVIKRIQGQGRQRKPRLPASSQPQGYQYVEPPKNCGSLADLTTRGDLKCIKSKYQGFLSLKSRQQLVLAWEGTICPLACFRVAGRWPLPNLWPDSSIAPPAGRNAWAALVNNGACVDTL